MGDPKERLSDAERDQTVEWLRDHLLAGRLTLEEFSQRVDQAYAARVRADLQQLRLGLPSPEPLPEGRSRRRATRFTGALFGRVVKRGRITLRRWTVAGGAFCDVDLDLREAEIQAQRTTLTVLVGFGNVDVYVPENVNVTVSGVTIGGRRREWGEDIERRSAPAISVRAISLLGTIDVWRVPANMLGDYGEIFRQLEGRQRELPR
jgi:Domain of unknown function (DUF1707)/Cell wall-active antibiotics response 4TMS YvqF